MNDFSRIRGATLSRIGRNVDGMTVAAQGLIFADYDIEPNGSNKGDRVADFLRQVRSKKPESFMQALSDIAHPNNFPQSGDSVVQEINKILRADGIVSSWHNGSYSFTLIDDIVDGAVGRLTATPKEVVPEHGRSEDVKPFDSFFEEPFATKKSPPPAPSTLQATRKVFVVYGRANAVNHAFFDFLRAAALQPLEWGQIVKSLGNPMPFTLEIVKHGLSIAQAVVVLVTPDETSELRDEFVAPPDTQTERSRRQPRPNVLIELGMALGIDSRRTLIVKFGNVELGSDVHGMNAVQFDGSAQSRHEVVSRLRLAGCDVDTSGNHWLTSGSFPS